MANIRKEIGRHVWREQLLKLEPKHQEGLIGVQLETRKGVICTNCRFAWDFETMGSSPPVLGCISDSNLMNMGNSRLADHREQESRLRQDETRRDEREAGYR